MTDAAVPTEGTYDYAGKEFRIVKQDGARWRVFDGDSRLGDVVELPGSQESGRLFTLETNGDPNPHDEPAARDWHAALEFLIDNTAPPVGA
jgi:hypothetical protein